MQKLTWKEVVEIRCSGSAHMKPEQAKELAEKLGYKYFILRGQVYRIVQVTKTEAREIEALVSERLNLVEKD